MSEDTTAPAPGSQPLKNARHELWAQEVAGGSSKTDAYIEAYPGSAEWKRAAINVKASTLGARPEVQERVAYLQERAADSSVYTLHNHIARLNSLAKAAEKAGDFRAAIKAEEIRGRAAGHQNNRIELTGRGGGPIETKQTRDLTDQELADALAKYGIKPRTA